MGRRKHFTHSQADALREASKYLGGPARMAALETTVLSDAAKSILDERLVRLAADLWRYAKHTDPDRAEASG